MRPFDQSCAKAACAPQPLLDALHPAGIRLVIVAEKMQQAVQGEDFQFGEL